MVESPPTCWGSRRSAALRPASGRGDRSTLDPILFGVSDVFMAGVYPDPVQELKAMQERVRAIRTRCCEPKTNTNPRYLALSNVVSNLSRAIEDLEAEAT